MRKMPDTKPTTVPQRQPTHHRIVGFPDPSIGGWCPVRIIKCEGEGCHWCSVGAPFQIGEGLSAP